MLIECIKIVSGMQNLLTLSFGFSIIRLSTTATMIIAPNDIVKFMAGQ